MKSIKAQHIAGAAQGLSGIIDLLIENGIAKDLGDDFPELRKIDSVTEGNLLTAAKRLADQLNGDTANLDDYDFVKRENS